MTSLYFLPRFQAPPSNIATTRLGCRMFGPTGLSNSFVIHFHDSVTGLTIDIKWSANIPYDSVTRENGIGQGPVKF